MQVYKKQLLGFFLFVICHLQAQEKVTLSGIIVDKKNNETLIGVSVVVPKIKASVNTNEYGFYSITLPKGNYTIEVSYIGYQSISQEVVLDKNQKLNMSLNSAETQLDEVVITDTKRATNIKKPEMSVNKLTVATIKKMPVIFGEVDVLKSILLLPGVTNAGEGQSGFNVRGGGADQNLVLLDEATLFNSSHVFGFFSVFNADAIKDLKLYKGAIPARYGGRASSVLEIYQKDGNSNKLSINGGLGLISSRLLAEGPIEKGKSSFLIGGRASYIHLFLKLSEEQKNNAINFYDLNTKLTFKINPKNNLYFSGYFGRDVFSLNDSFTNTYGNTTFNSRWNHLFSDKLFSNLSLIYSDYYYGLNLGFVGFQWESGIKNYNIKYDFKHYISTKLKLNYGLNATYYRFNPGVISPIDINSGINYKQLDKKSAFETAFYLEAEQELSDKLSVSYGLRYGIFYRLGTSKIAQYQDNLPVVFNNDFQIYQKATPIGYEYYGSNKKIASYDNLEPRLAASYQINDDQSIKLSYTKMTQYLQLISNTASPTPLDVWMPSDKYIKPQIANQFAIGYFKNFNNKLYSLEIESFYKKIKNRIDYIDGANLIANDAIEQVVLNGQMRAYGLEMMLRKNEGDFNGWISYTLSKSEQQTPGRFSNETGINGGKWYNTAYDKTHNLAITANYKKSDRWSFGANFTLQSGQPVTYPNGQYVYQDIVIPNYGLRNENNLPVYHHLDISAVLSPKKYKWKNYKSEWVFGIYNIYNRKNAASIAFRKNTDLGTNEAVRTSIFGIVPSVSYNFKF
jgi:hypothetical protein